LHNDFSETMISDSRIQPAFSHCCLNRKVSLSNMRQTPKFLHELLNPDNGAISKKFQSNIQAYNSMFALHRWVQRSIILLTTNHAHMSFRLMADTTI
jgi:hypothetical protein